jgi:hypothetical protein
VEFVYPELFKRAFVILIPLDADEESHVRTKTYDSECAELAIRGFIDS